MNYEVFHRTWWRRNKNYPNGLEPSAGRKTHIRYVDTQEQARGLCQEWNEENKNRLGANKLSRKAEYQSV